MNKSAIITVTQGDFLYIKDWIEYHHQLGVNLILIGYNGDMKNKDKLPQYDYVRYIDFSFDKSNPLFYQFNRENRGFSGIDFYTYKNELTFMCRCLNILNDYIKFFHNDIQYVMPIDIDEYIILNTYTNINEFLKDNFDQSLSSMQIVSTLMTDNNQIYYEDKPVLERFTESTYKKLISNFRWKYHNYKSIINIYHYNIQRDIQIISSPHNISMAPKNVVNERECYIKHFYTKSMEEYLLKFKIENDNDYSRRFKKKMLFNYFYVNKPTTEKFYAWNELCKKHNIKFDIYQQIEPGPYHKFIKNYCDLFGYDFNILVENFEKDKDLRDERFIQ